MKNYPFIMVFILLTSIFSMIPAQTSKPPQIRSQMLVSTDWLAKNLKQPSVVILHIGRDRKNYDQGHIPGARFLQYSTIVETRNGVLNELPPIEKLTQVFSQAGINRDSRIILLCESSGLMAARVYFTLDYLGYGDKAALLDGGLEKWKSEKREITTVAPEIKSGNFSAALNPKILTTRNIVNDISWASTNQNEANSILIDARPPDAYDGSTPNANLPTNGHIPGAGNVYWMQNLTSQEMPTLKAPADIRKRYEAVGVTADKKMVTYCWIGMMASHDYFTLKYLGYDVSMYDGSFTEWAKSEGAKAVTGKNPK